jgi:hypothetical protein
MPRLIGKKVIFTPGGVAQCIASASETVYHWFASRDAVMFVVI